MSQNFSIKNAVASDVFTGYHTNNHFSSFHFLVVCALWKKKKSQNATKQAILLATLDLECLICALPLLILLLSLLLLQLPLLLLLGKILPVKKLNINLAYGTAKRKKKTKHFSFSIVMLAILSLASHALTWPIKASILIKMLPNVIMIIAAGS